MEESYYYQHREERILYQRRYNKKNKDRLTAWKRDYRKNIIDMKRIISIELSTKERIQIASSLNESKRYFQEEIFRHGNERRHRLMVKGYGQRIKYINSLLEKIGFDVYYQKFTL